LTSSTMQELALKRLSYSGNQAQVTNACEAPEAVNKSYCAAWASGNYEDLRNNSARFENDGSLSSWVLYGTDPDAFFEPGFVNQGRINVTREPELGGYVSVLPGVYGIQFTDSQTGETRSQYGIKAQ
jgi:hypothetical protein